MTILLGVLLAMLGVGGVRVPDGSANADRRGPAGPEPDRLNPTG
jgi:hypothetical protein